MAAAHPEYSYEVDLWSVGVCLYEFICGKVPFGDDHEDPFYIFEEILEGDLVFPNTINDSKLINLATLLLDPSQKNREKMAPQWLLCSSKIISPLFFRQDRSGHLETHAGQPGALQREPSRTQS